MTMAKTPSLKASKRAFALSLRSTDTGLMAQTSEIASFVVYSGDCDDPHEGESTRRSALAMRAADAAPNALSVDNEQHD